MMPAHSSGASSHVGVPVGQPVGVRGGHGGVLGVAAVGVPAGVARVRAQVLARRGGSTTHSPQVCRSQATPTRSPDREPGHVRRRAPRPRRPPRGRAPPAARCGGRSPSATCRSVRHTPHALTRTSSSSAAGSGTGRVTAQRPASASARAWPPPRPPSCHSYSKTTDARRTAVPPRNVSGGSVKFRRRRRPSNCRRSKQGKGHACAPLR